jgi:hypothetical protein
MEQRPESDALREQAANPPSRTETAGRLAFLVAAGLLLSVLVSCACGPTR